MRVRTLTILLVSLFLLFSSFSVEAKRRKQKRKGAARPKGDFIKMNDSKIKGKKKGAQNLDGFKYPEGLGTGTKPEFRAPKKFLQSFDPYKELSIVAEDTSTIQDAETNIVEVSEEIRVDSAWVKIAEYYSIWDSRIVNPYKIDRYSFDEPVNIVLFDSTKGYGYAMPQRKTKVNSKFGMRGWRPHFGIDLELDTGDSIYAAFDGIIRIVAYEGGGWGKFVLIRHYNGLETLYGHLSKHLVQTGTYVKAGDLIGLGGSTGRSSGPHLHLEVRYQGNPINPEDIYDFENWTLQASEFVLTQDNFRYNTTVARRVIYHRVRQGDNLYAIARSYGTTVSRLKKLNGNISSVNLKPGKRIRVK